MNIYEDKKKKYTDSDITVAYISCVIGCLGISELLYIFQTGIEEADGLVWWITTVLMYGFIIGAAITLVAAMLHGLGYSGKRKKIDNIF